MWIVTFLIRRNGKSAAEDGRPRYFGHGEALHVPRIDETVIHRGEAFIVDDVVTDLERQTITVELVPTDEVMPVAVPTEDKAQDDEQEGQQEEA